MARELDDLPDHVRLVGILTAALGALAALGAVMLLLVAGVTYFPSPGEDPATLVGTVLWSLLAVLALALVATWGIAAGAGLLSRQGWARVLALPLAALSLVAVPFGTMYGVYALYVLTRPGVDGVLDAALPWAR